MSDEAQVEYEAVAYDVDDEGSRESIVTPSEQRLVEWCDHQAAAVSIEITIHEVVTETHETLIRDPQEVRDFLDGLRIDLRRDEEPDPFDDWGLDPEDYRGVSSDLRYPRLRW